MLQAGTVSTNVFLRRLHNFCVDMNWLPWPLIPKRQWPAVRFKDKRAITLEEHQQIIAAEVNPERKALYQLCWHLGASQGDIANLKGEDVDWTERHREFRSQKDRRAGLVHLGTEALNLFKDLPAEGVLFPYLSRVRADDRATEFRSRCRQLGITGVTLHSYRYAWAERAKTVGVPGRLVPSPQRHCQSRRPGTGPRQTRSRFRCQSIPQSPGPVAAGRSPWNPTMFANLNFPDGFTFSLIGQIHKKQFIEATLAEHLRRQLGYVIGCGDDKYR